MLVPRLVKKLYVPNSALEHSSSEQTVVGERRSARIHMRDGRYISRKQVDTAVHSHGIELEELEKKKKKDR